MDKPTHIRCGKCKGMFVSGSIEFSEWKNDDGILVKVCRECVNEGLPDTSSDEYQLAILVNEVRGPGTDVLRDFLYRKVHTPLFIDAVTSCILGLQEDIGKLRRINEILSIKHAEENKEESDE